LKKSIVLLLIFIFFAGLSLFVLYGGRSRVSSVDIKTLPAKIGSWQLAEDIKFQERVIDILGTDAVIGRIYRDKAGRTVELIIVKAVNNRSAFHPPEYCMTGAGSELAGRGAVSIAIPEIKGGLVEVNEMVFSTDHGNDILVHNFYAAGRDYYSNFYLQQTRIVTDRMFKGFSRGMAVNVYTEIKFDDKESARSASEDFIKALLPVLTQYSE